MKLKDRVEMFNEVVALSEKLTTYSERFTATSVRAYHAEEVFNKLCLHLKSFQRNLYLEKEEGELVDISVLASISRMIVEASNAVFYFTDRGVSESEVEFRVWLSARHQDVDLQVILDKLNIKFAHIVDTSHYAIEVLENNGYYKSLTSSEQKTLMKGQKAYYRRGNRSSMNPFPKEIEEGIYKLLSNYVHSFPAGNSLYTGRATLHPLNFQNSAFIIIETALCYSSAAIWAYVKLRWKLGKRLDDEEKQFLKNISQGRVILHWLEKERPKYSSDPLEIRS
ncbi:hypothetical protein FV768_24925 [Vibrio parahaemolyticus]|nr:hypothetical protein [Vibrio parahaemolyticus]EJE8521536.1 hypothetical protein [Vibrio parahaemolyticus]EJL6383558.1 hypothetical protein [Vibrio parahaemolyticus]HCE3105524.1 hypothetical protein [Vibrio parahaemolyticus]HCG8269728.1 hypothetical protein [Vibrio parahaemolyticus]